MSQSIDDIKKPEERNDKPADPTNPEGAKKDEQAKVNLEDKAAPTKRNVVHGDNVNRP